MSDNFTYRTPMFEIKLGELADQKSSVPNAIQLFKVGTFDHPQYGVFEISSKILLSMKANFDKKVRGIDLAVDFSHNSENEAAGWFQDVYLSDDNKELWAKVAWTPGGEKVLSEKEFRYVSPEFSFNYKSNENENEFGPTLLGAGLTNRPVIKGMTPVVELNEVTKKDLKPSGHGSLNKKASNNIKTKIQGDIKMGEQDLSKLSPDELVKMCQELQAQLAEMKKEHGVMSEDKEKLAQAVKYAEQNSKFDKMILDGKAVEAQRDAFMKNDIVKFSELAKSVNLSGHGNAAQSEVDTSGDPSAQVQKLAEKLLEAKKAINLSDAYRIVFEQNPKLSEAIYGVSNNIK